MKRSTLLAGLGAATAAAPLCAGAQSGEAISLATVAIDALGVPFYAADNGGFVKAGIDLTLTQSHSGGGIVAAITSGSYDIGGANMASLIIAFRRKLPITIIAPGAIFDGSAPILELFVKKDAPIHSARDLEGKVIGIEGLGNIGQYATSAWIDKNGGDATKVKWVEMPFADMAGALEQGRISANIVAEPFLTRQRATARVLASPYSSIAPGVMTTAYFTSTAWLSANPAKAAHFGAVIREYAIWANRNRAASGAILGKYSKLDPSLVSSMSRVRYAEKVTPALVQPLIDLLARYNAIDAPFDAKLMIDPAVR